MPIDLFGPSRAAFGVAGLTCAYGLMQTFFSPAIGTIVDHVGFTTVCFSMAALPLVGVDNSSRDMPLKPRIKSWLFALIGKDPEAVVVSFCSGDEALSRAMCEEIRRLEPSRRHFEAHANESWRDLRRRFRGYRIGLAPVLFTGDASFRGLRRAALLLAPTKILAYNTRLERHHLSSTLASWLFLRGVPLDRIFLRPRWLFPWKRDKTIRPDISSPSPGPSARPEAPFDRNPHSVFSVSRFRTAAPCGCSTFFARSRANSISCCTRFQKAPKPASRRCSNWSRKFIWSPSRAIASHDGRRLVPPEAGEYRSPAMQRLIDARETDLLQVEYTYLARYGGDILVEHDVTFDLYAQVHSRRRRHQLLVGSVAMAAFRASIHPEIPPRGRDVGKRSLAVGY